MALKRCICCDSGRTETFENGSLVCRKCGLIFHEDDKTIEESMEESRG